jgi:hypothetical protein
VNRLEIISAAKAAGFTHVQTLAGGIPLDSWLANAEWAGKYVDYYLDGDRIRETPKANTILPKLDGKLLLGVWPLESEVA